MKLGLSMWSYVAPWKRGEVNATDFIQRCSQMQLDGVELLDFFFRDKTDWTKEARAIQDALQETALPVGVFSVGNDFATASPADRAAQVGVVRRGVDQARVFGADVVRVFAGGSCEGHANEEVFGWFVEGLAEASRYAADNGVRLALENHGLIAGRSHQVCELIESVRERCGNEALGANPDTGNFLLVNEDPADAMHRVAKYAFMCHFKDFVPAGADYSGPSYAALDGTRFKGTAIGEGTVNLQECIEALRAAGFRGWVNIEYEAEEHPDAGVPRSVANARTYVPKG